MATPHTPQRLRPRRPGSRRKDPAPERHPGRPTHVHACPWPLVAGCRPPRPVFCETNPIGAACGAIPSEAVRPTEGPLLDDHTEPPIRSPAPAPSGPRPPERKESRPGPHRGPTAERTEGPAPILCQAIAKRTEFVATWCHQMPYDAPAPAIGLAVPGCPCPRQPLRSTRGDLRNEPNSSQRPPGEAHTTPLPRPSASSSPAGPARGSPLTLPVLGGGRPCTAKRTEFVATPFAPSSYDTPAPAIGLVAPAGPARGSPLTLPVLGGGPPSTAKRTEFVTRPHATSAYEAVPASPTSGCRPARCLRSRVRRAAADGSRSSKPRRTPPAS
jgi:hypothetical protein